MRTPPPVLPPEGESGPHYKSTWFDRAGPDGELKLKAIGYGLMVFGITVGAAFFIMAQGGSGAAGGFAVLGVFVIAAIIGSVTMVMGLRLADTAGAVAKAFTMPSGASTPYEDQFSYQEAMVMKGDVAGALASYEAVIAERPGVAVPRLKAAEHYAKGNRDLARAAELFREVRDMVGASQRDAVYASNRLVDLYDGPLSDPGRALVELRRIVERYPGTPAAAHARSALPAMKARIQGPSSGAT